MNSATSTNRALASGRAAALQGETQERHDAAAAFKPWQFFLLIGMLAATATVVVATGQSPAAIVLLSLTVVAAAFVGLAVYRSLAPLVLPERGDTPALLGGRTRAALEREKTLALRAIKELEFDFAMKKVAKADFDEMAGRLRARAIRIMRQLDAGEGYRSAIEQELEARLGTTLAEPAASSAPVRATLACACGVTNDPDARFCKSCGVRLSHEEQEN
jgi:hypothetical protein